MSELQIKPADVLPSPLARELPESGSLNSRLRFVSGQYVIRGIRQPLAHGYPPFHRPSPLKLGKSATNLVPQYSERTIRLLGAEFPQFRQSPIGYIAHSRFHFFTLPVTGPELVTGATGLMRLFHE